MATVNNMRIQSSCTDLEVVCLILVLKYMHHSNHVSYGFGIYNYNFIYLCKIINEIRSMNYLKWQHK